MKSNTGSIILRSAGLFYTLILIFTCQYADAASPVKFSAPWDSPYSVDKTYPYHFRNANGNYLFIINKTAWMFFGCKNPEAFLRKARQEGVNVIRVALECSYFYETIGIDLWPWGGTRENPDYDTFNKPYWDEVERRITLAGKMGIGIDLCLYGSVRPTTNDIDTQRKYWKYVLNRLGRYSNILTWEIQNEYIKNIDFQRAAGTYFVNHDRFKRAVCTSDGTTDNAALTYEPWIGIAIGHSCTGSTPRRSDITSGSYNPQSYNMNHLKYWYQSVARNLRSHGKPAFINETGREQRHHNNDGIHRRKQSWIFNMSGVFWTLHSWDGCEGIDDSTYKAPGAEYLPAIRTLFDTLPFWTLTPDYTAIQWIDNPHIVFSSLANLKRDYVLGYACTVISGEKHDSDNIYLRLPRGNYKTFFINPSNLTIIKQTDIASPGIHKHTSIKTPRFTDDLLIFIRRISLN